VKLHDLQPAPGSKTARTRVGRGIAAGKGKTAGRGTKGQRSRSGGSLPAWFEGGQTPLQMRVPKLRGFKNRFKVEYEVVNVGRIAQAVEAGRLAAPEASPEGAAKGRRAKAAPPTVNAELLRAAGLIGSLRRPLKVLGGGDVEAPLFVIADAFSASARSKIEAAGGTAQALEVPAAARPAKRISAAAGAPAGEETPATLEAPAAVEAPAAELAAPAAEATVTAEPETPAPEPETAPAETANPAEAPAAAPARAPRARKRPAPPAGE
jgi:large subunit ribosomal protein L15